MSFLSAAVLLFLVQDPLGNIPLFIPALRTVKPERVSWVILRESLIALTVMICFLFLGGSMLHVLHVSQSALTAAGGVILILIAIRMIFPTGERNLQEATLGEPFIVPLAIPYCAGPSLLATIILLATREPGRWPVFLGAIILSWACATALLLSSGLLQRLLGERTLTAMERLMGMVLVIISMQMLLSGVTEFFADAAAAPGAFGLRSP